MKKTAPETKPKPGRPFGPKKVTLTVLVLESTKTAIKKKAVREGLSAGQVLDADYGKKPKA